MAPLLEEVESVKMMRLEPGDRVVLLFPGPLPKRALAVLRDQLDRMFPDNPVIILDNGATLEVLKGADPPA